MERKLNQYLTNKIYKDQPIESVRIESQTVTFGIYEYDKMQEYIKSLMEDVISQENLMDFSGREVTIIEPIKIELMQIADKFTMKAFEVLGIIIPK